MIPKRSLNSTSPTTAARDMFNEEGPRPSAMAVAQPHAQKKPTYDIFYAG